MGHLKPFVSNLPVIDHTKILRVVMQNTQFAFSIYSDLINISNILSNVKQLDTHIFAPISPIINWHNNGHHSCTQALFRKAFPQVHLSATSSNVGLHKELIDKSLVGVTVVLSLGIWASKVSNSWSDPSGMGSFTVTTISGKHEKKIVHFSIYCCQQRIRHRNRITVCPTNRPLWATLFGF